MKKVCIFFAETVKENVQLPRCISVFFKERAAASERYQWTLIENVQLIFFCVCGCFEKDFNVF